MLAETILHFPIIWQGISPLCPHSFRYQISSIALFPKLLGASIKYKRQTTHLKLSIQSIPFGSSFENTKQLNASLNCSPHGPVAMPPKHGQSQFISPVSSLKAPSCEASCSVSSKVSGSVVEAGAGTDGCELFGLFVFTDSRVGSDVSSEEELGGGTATGERTVSLGTFQRGYQGTNKEVLQRIMCLYYSNILLQPPIPVSLPCFSSSATFALVARWRGSGGLGLSGAR